MPDSDLIVAAFTELAPDYEPTVDRELRMFWGISYHDFAARLLTLAGVITDKDILDVATGTGYLPLQLASLLRARGAAGGRIVGLDLTPAMLVHAAARLAAARQQDLCRLVCGSGLAMPLAGASFDVALCALGTHHIEASLLMSEMHRVLRPGGRLVLADLCANAFWRSVAGAALLRILVLGYGLALHSDRARAEVEAFDNVLTVEEWRALLAGHGYVDIVTDEVRPRYPWYPGGFIARATRP